MERRLGRLGAGALALALAAGCGADRREAEGAVRAYNEAAIHAYRTRDFAPLQKVATEKEWGRVVVLVDLKSASKLVLESELQALEVTKVERPGPDGMVVETRERWRYYDRPLEPGRPAGQVFVADMVLRYEFERAKEGGWRMGQARTLSAKYLEPKGFQLEAAGGH
jgi:hypothetical protein